MPYSALTEDQGLSKIDRSQFERLMREELPFAHDMGLKVEHVSTELASLRAPFSAQSLRPGGTVSGPTMMGLADVALYLLVLANVGHQPLAVTTSLNFNFLRKPPPSDLLAEARPLKIGRRLVVGDVSMYAANSPDQLIAHATGTYSVPPEEAQYVR